MVAIDLDLLLHNTIRLFMREKRMSADRAYDAAVPVVLNRLAQGIDDAAELDIHRTVLLELRESILPAYRKPQPDLNDLSPLIHRRSAAAAKRQRQRRRQLGGRP